MNLTRIAMALAVFLSATGCGPSTPSVAPAPSVSPELGRDFDPAQTGTLRGTVVWRGVIPEVPPLLVNLPGIPTKAEPNPNQPRIDPESRGVAGALVYVQSVDLARSRPWDHGPVQVAVKDGKIDVFQDGKPVTIGLVRQAEVVDWSNQDDAFFSLRARGAAFFSIPFVKSGSTSRALAELGHVEVSAGSGQFWLRKHLFASPHPYVCVTDATGAFAMPHVPAGEYEVRCWLPNWQVESLDADPETRILVRATFGKALESATKAQVASAETTVLSLSFEAAPRP